MRRNLARWALRLAPILALTGLVLVVLDATRATRRALHLLVGFSLLDWLDNLVRGSLGFLSAPLRAVAGFVGRVVRGATNWLLDRIEGVVGWVWSILQAAKDFAVDLVSDVWDFFGVVWTQIAAARDWVWRNASQLVSNLAGVVSNLARMVWDRISDLTGWIVHQIDNILKWVGDNVLGPFLRFVGGIYNWIRDNIWDPIWSGIRGALSAIDKVWDWVFDKVTGVLKWIQDAGSLLWDVVMGALDWLLFLGRWGFDAIQHLLSPGNFLSADWWAETATKAAQQSGEIIEDTLVKWLD